MGQVPISDIRVADDNALIYGNFSTDNHDDWELVMSIRAHGIQEPLVVSEDKFLLSGHRRLSAAARLCLGTVPARVVDVRFVDLPPQLRLETLRRFNQQREKTPGEKLREALLTIKPEQAHQELKAAQREARDLSHAPAANVRMGAVKSRAEITTRQFLEKAQQVIDENEEYQPLTVRRVHYLLLNDPPLRHDSKPDSRYVNDKASYKALTNLLIRARLTGDVSMAAIEDPTRPIQLGGGFDTFEQFVAQETRGFLRGYSRNLMQGQTVHVEIMLEKNALRTVIEAVARDYCIPVTTGRGFSSLTPRDELDSRFRSSGKDRLVLLMLTDFDPDGEEIAASFARSLRDDFEIDNIHAVKVALTADDVRKYDLPSDMDAKVGSPNYERFVAEHGTKVVELDAAPVKLLQSKLREAIEGVLDMDEFEAQKALEVEDSAHIAAHRKIVQELIAKATP